MWLWINKFAAPKNFYQIAGTIIPWTSILCALLFLYGLIGGLILAPPDYQQGDAFRIIYVHVPSALLSMLIYISLAIAAVINLVWRIKLADIIIAVSAPLGAAFTFLALSTGAFWGKPMWGTWWVWDARLTSELILLFIYLGVIALRAAIPLQESAARASAILLIVGIVNIPIIHYSVAWWNTLHQGETLTLTGASLIAPAMLHPLWAMILAFICYAKTIILIRARTEILRREKQSQWIQAFLRN